MITELVPGAVNLKSLLGDGKKFSLGNAHRFFRQALSGLAYCHSNGVAHGDLKASNILITKNTLKISNLGLNSLLQPFSRELLADLEANYYLPPEALRASTAPLPCDVWALGVLLFRMVVGQYPFSGNSIPTLLTAIANQP